MATKTLRTVRDAKFPGTFTKQQIDRAIRIVERDRGSDNNPQRDRVGSAATRRGAGSSGGKR
jgi:hypothetical protein